VLGAGMSSRLFQRVREELGLAYTVYAFHSFYEHAGVTGVYVGTQPATAKQAVEAIELELDRLTKEGLAGDALAEAKQQLKGQVTLGLESPSSRMYRAAGIVLYRQPYKSIDQVLSEIDEVRPADVASVAEEFFDPERQTAVWLGPN
jgi:predicted Zn-dependent peptidase